MPALKEKPVAQGLHRVYSQDGFQDMEFTQAQQAVRMSHGKLRFERLPHVGWEKEVPRYRATREIVQAALKPSDRTDHPFSAYGSGNRWQYGERDVKGGEEISTTAWPHSSFHPLNESAKQVLAYFNQNDKARMRKSPWQDGRVDLPSLY